MDYPREGKCCICGGEYTQWGNNALPLKDGRCCNLCNGEYVLPARIQNMEEGKSIYEIRK